MTMVLTVAVPMRVASEMRVGRRTRVVNLVEDVALITSVRRLRRIRHAGGSLDDDRCVVEAFIPEHERCAIEAVKGSWLSHEYLRCYARLSLNRKTLSPFFESGEFELCVDEH